MGANRECRRVSLLWIDVSQCSKGCGVTRFLHLPLSQVVTLAPIIAQWIRSNPPVTGACCPRPRDLSLLTPYCHNAPAR